MGLGLMGMLMIGVWALTADVGGVRAIGNCDANAGEMCLLSYADGFRILFEWIGRTLVTTVVFCDFIVAMVLRDWEATQKKNDVLRPEHYVDFEAFHKELRSQ